VEAMAEEDLLVLMEVVMDLAVVVDMGVAEVDTDGKKKIEKKAILSPRAGRQIGSSIGELRVANRKHRLRVQSGVR